MEENWRTECFLKGARYRWKTANKHYVNFTDLGRYVIDCDRHWHFDFEKARDYVNRRYDFRRKMGCTALATQTDCGDIVIGRNLDLTVSQLPCYITHVKYGKYDTLNFTYDELQEKALRYDALLHRGVIDPALYNALPMLASDSMNDQGLYMEYNMRSFEPKFLCTGTNPGCPTRICTVSLPFVVTSHCATVPEALEFMRHQLDLYTLTDHSAASGWNLCCMIGDAVGHYGLIEIANNEIHYLPRQHGQGNYYIFPEYNSISRNQSGYGRLQFGLERIDQVQNEEQMAALMEQVMWRNEILTIPYAYQDSHGHIHFCADPEHRIPSLDWRSDHVKLIPVNADGKYIDIDCCTPEAEKVRIYRKCYQHYLAGSPDAKARIGYEKYKQYLDRSDLVWVQTNEHFEDLQRGLMKHYRENGTFEKLARYYAGDERPLRDDAGIFTTALSFSVNCTQKRLTVKFWENPTTVMIYQF